MVSQQIMEVMDFIESARGLLAEDHDNVNWDKHYSDVEKLPVLIIQKMCFVYNYYLHNNLLDEDQELIVYQSLLDLLQDTYFELYVLQRLLSD